MNTEDLNKLMAESAKDAINYIQSIHGAAVTLCHDDLTVVDTVLTKLAISQIPDPLSQENLFTVCSILGAFVGEIFKNTAGGEWFMDESVPDAPFVVLNYAGKSFPFSSVCYEKIVNQPEISLAKYFELALGGATQ
jgi:hypothetical protein